ncbi:MAG TPA: hypothetical protein ENI53_00690 [Thermoplasmatales archaeon]|nr:hypothetical protein [Thermoplasmatales archaeon]
MIGSIRKKLGKIPDYIFFAGITVGIFLILLSFTYGKNFGITGSLIICFFIFLEIFLLLKQ